MNLAQNRPPIGRNCRSSPARVAGRGSGAPASHLGIRGDRKMPLFAQFPPASLFKAIGRAVSRRAITRQAASGTALANGRLWRSAGGP
jgi:hypothetical protein